MLISRTTLVGTSGSSNLPAWPLLMIMELWCLLPQVIDVNKTLVLAFMEMEHKYDV